MFRLRAPAAASSHSEMGSGGCGGGSGGGPEGCGDGRLACPFRTAVRGGGLPAPGTGKPVLCLINTVIASNKCGPEGGMWRGRPPPAARFPAGGGRTGRSTWRIPGGSIALGSLEWRPCAANERTSQTNRQAVMTIDIPDDPSLGSGHVGSRSPDSLARRSLLPSPVSVFFVFSVFPVFSACRAPARRRRRACSPSALPCSSASGRPRRRPRSSWSATPGRPKEERLPPWGMTMRRNSPPAATPWATS